MFVSSLGLLLRTQYDLDANWSRTLQIREGHTLVTNGLYQKVRHPMYTYFILALGNWPGTGINQLGCRIVWGSYIWCFIFHPYWD